VEKVYFVKNGDLSDVNRALSSGGKIKSISTIQEPFIAFSGGEREYSSDSNGVYNGNVCAYIVIEYDR